MIKEKRKISEVVTIFSSKSFEQNHWNRLTNKIINEKKKIDPEKLFDSSSETSIQKWSIENFFFSF